jgi:hypothetical protein
MGKRDDTVVIGNAEAYRALVSANARISQQPLPAGSSSTRKQVGAREQNRQLPRPTRNMTARDNRSERHRWITSMEYKDMEPFFVKGESDEP